MPFHFGTTPFKQSDPDNRKPTQYIHTMSAAEIIKELPKLTEADRRAIREVLSDIANQDPNVAACNLSALEGAMTLDRMEDEAARRQFR